MAVVGINKGIAITLFSACVVVGIILFAVKGHTTYYISQTKCIELYPIPEEGEKRVPSGDIIKSISFLEEIAAKVGSERIMRKSDAVGNAKRSAAGLIQRNLTVEREHGGQVLRIRFRHPDSGICEGVLREILDSYYRPRFQNGTGPSMTIVEQPSKPRLVTGWGSSDGWK